jgi:hypothetical protein
LLDDNNVVSCSTASWCKWGTLAYPSTLSSPARMYKRTLGRRRRASQQAVPEKAISIHNDNPNNDNDRRIMAVDDLVAKGSFVTPINSGLLSFNRWPKYWTFCHFVSGALIWHHDSGRHV